MSTTKKTTKKTSSRATKATKATKAVSKETVVDVTPEQPAEQPDVTTETTPEQPAEQPDVTTETTPEQPAEQPDVTSEESNDADDAVKEVSGDEEVMSYDQVQALLSDKDVSLDDKLQIIMDKAGLGLRTCVASLVSYVDSFKNVDSKTPTQMLSEIYNVYNVIKSTLAVEDQIEFKTRMMIIDMLFRQHTGVGAAFESVRLLHYDYLWMWGDTSLKTHQLLVVIITSLAEPSTRAEELKKIDINSQAFSDGLEVTKEQFERLIRYYS